MNKKPKEDGPITILTDDRFNSEEGDLIIKLPEKNLPEED